MSEVFFPDGFVRVSGENTCSSLNGYLAKDISDTTVLLAIPPVVLFRRCRIFCLQELRLQGGGFSQNVRLLGL